MKLIKVYKRGARKAESRFDVQKALVNYCGLKQDVAKIVALPGWSEWTPKLQESLFVQFEALKSIQGWDESVFNKISYIKED